MHRLSRKHSVWVSGGYNISPGGCSAISTASMILFSIMFPFPLRPAHIHTDTAWEEQHPLLSKVCRLQLLLVRSREGDTSLLSHKSAPRSIYPQNKLSALIEAKWEAKRDQMKTVQVTIWEPGLLGKLLPLSEKPWKIRRNKLSISPLLSLNVGSLFCLLEKGQARVLSTGGRNLLPLRQEDKVSKRRGHGHKYFALRQLSSNPAHIPSPNCRGDRHVLLTRRVPKRKDSLIYPLPSPLSKKMLFT